MVSPDLHHIFATFFNLCQPWKTCCPLPQELRAEIQELHRSLAEAEAKYAQMERENTNAPDVTWSKSAWGILGQGMAGGWLGEIWAWKTDKPRGFWGSKFIQIHFDQLRCQGWAICSAYRCPGMISQIDFDILYCLKPQATIYSTHFQDLNLQSQLMVFENNFAAVRSPAELVLAIEPFRKVPKSY